MSESKRLRKIVARLATKTEAGEVKWEATDSPGTWIAEFAGFIVELSGPEASETDPSMALKGTVSIDVYETSSPSALIRAATQVDVLTYEPIKGPLDGVGIIDALNPQDPLSGDLTRLYFSVSGVRLQRLAALDSLLSQLEE